MSETLASKDLGIHAVVIRGQRLKGVLVREMLECACGAHAVTTQPDSEEWQTMRAAFRAEHR